jgi:hypothetical protein
MLLEELTISRELSEEVKNVVNLWDSQVSQRVLVASANRRDEIIPRGSCQNILYIGIFSRNLNAILWTKL